MGALAIPKEMIVSICNSLTNLPIASTSAYKSDENEYYTEG